MLFLERNCKDKDVEDIDRIISAEIPDRDFDPQYYSAVQDFMVHGPCGVARKSSPCMKDGRCTKHFPKRFVETTCKDDDGYPVYKRRDNGRTVVKSNIALDNKHIVPHNRHLLMKYRAHINVEWCNQSRSIKYLFKYIHKGDDRVTTAFYKSNGDGENDKTADEVQMYYDCRYISPCEAAWRILGFEMKFIDPPVERLSFHLPNEQNVIFSDYEPIDAVINRASVGETMFLAWFEANKKYPQARKLTYVEFPTEFVWNASKRQWTPRQKRISIGRIFYVPPGSGEMYYLRCLLNVVRGPTCYEDIRTVNNVLYDSFRDACYALGLLDDDKEYIDGIIEASHFASAQALRKLFATLLASGSLGRPEVVWDKCWSYISDDILYNRRISLRHPGIALKILISL